jgi:predicted metalloprotease with PDZ domain
VGPPGNQVELNNLHELMSLQFGLGAFQVERNVVAGIPVRIITPEESSFSPAERVWLMQRTSDIVKTVTGIFSGTPYPAMSFFYFRGEGIGGLEGAYTCQAYVPEEVDLSNGENRKRTTFAMTALHEFFHTWNPIGLFARDDPWFKEGVTTYYGIVLSYRLGWLKTDSWVEWQGYYTKLLADNPLFKEVALSDPRIWDHEYDSENWRTLTYDRGLAVTLLLDVRIREATDNRKSLDSVLPLLFQRYLHNSFSRADLLAAIHKATGFDATDFFAGYVESITPPSAEEVAAGLARAKELKVFAPLNP